MTSEPHGFVFDGRSYRPQIRDRVIAATQQYHTAALRAARPPTPTREVQHGSHGPQQRHYIR